MNTIPVHTDPAVKTVFDNYPDRIRAKMLQLRQCIIDAAGETGCIDELVETLKWGEPSYLAKKGSTVRIDWKEKTPEQYAVYFKCTSKLVPTFKVVFGDVLKFEGSRAIVFSLNAIIPETALKECIKTALMYHQVKHDQLLGLSQSHSPNKK